MAVEFCDNEQLVIRASVPGLLAERDISVFISGDVLHIRANRAEPYDVPASDLRSGCFVRDIALPPDTDERDVTATYCAGVLEVRAPKGRGHVATRMVPVLVSGAAPR